MISVIIPTLNEESNIGRCIESLKREGRSLEIIVSDGGSADRTAAVASGYKGVRVLQSARGRGPQMNRGAEVAGGNILLFLHADTTLEKGWSGAILSSMGERSVGGAFTFSIDGPEVHYRLIEIWVAARCLLFRLPYGDQGIFVRRDVFERLGGYADMPIMEDVEFVERMKKAGPVRVLRKRAFTHDRRWKSGGWIRVSLSNQILMMLYRFGVEPRRLAKMYYR